MRFNRVGERIFGDEGDIAFNFPTVFLIITWFFTALCKKNPPFLLPSCERCDPFVASLSASGSQVRFMEVEKGECQGVEGGGLSACVCESAIAGDDYDETSGDVIVVVMQSGETSNFSFSFHVFCSRVCDLA